MPKQTIGADKSAGVAPTPVAVTYTAGTWTAPDGYKCIGFYVGGTAGNVIFDGLTYPVLANSYHGVEVTTITQAGTVASLFALLI